jgi:flagellar biogenesis protein FliO
MSPARCAVSSLTSLRLTPCVLSELRVGVRQSAIDHLHRAEAWVVSRSEVKEERQPQASAGDMSAVGQPKSWRP